MTDLLEKTNNYFINVKQKKNYRLNTPLDILISLDKNNNFFTSIYNGIDDSLKTTKFPFIKLHGDLWTSSLLIDKKTNIINYIDFEHSKEFELFYDILFICWAEFRLYQTLTFTRKFLDGIYDSLISKMFKIFDLKYNENLKLDYLNIFFLDQFAERITNTNESELKVMYSLYKPFIEFIKTNIP